MIKHLDRFRDTTFPHIFLLRRHLSTRACRVSERIDKRTRSLANRARACILFRLAQFEIGTDALEPAATSDLVVSVHRLGAARFACSCGTHVFEIDGRADHLHVVEGKLGSLSDDRAVYGD